MTKRKVKKNIKNITYKLIYDKLVELEKRIQKLEEK